MERQKDFYKIGNILKILVLNQLNTTEFYLTELITTKPPNLSNKPSPPPLNTRKGVRRMAELKINFFFMISSPPRRSALRLRKTLRETQKVTMFAWARVRVPPPSGGTPRWASGPYRGSVWSPAGLAPVPVRISSFTGLYPEALFFPTQSAEGKDRETYLGPLPSV